MKKEKEKENDHIYTQLKIMGYLAASVLLLSFLSSISKFISE